MTNNTLSTARDEENRRLAEWLGWKSNEGGTRWHSPACQRGEENCGGKIPDFYADEAANALLLEKMPRPMVYRDHRSGNWGAKYDFGVTVPRKEAVDRKAAIVKCALAYLEAQK